MPATPQLLVFIAAGALFVGVGLKLAMSDNPAQ